MIRLFRVHFSAQTILAAISDTLMASMIIFAVFFLPVFSNHSAGETVNIFLPGILLLVFWLWLLYTLDLYDTKMLRSPRMLFQRTSIAVGIVAFAGAFILNLVPLHRLPTGRFELLLVLFALLSIFIRWLMEWSSLYLGIGERLLILGPDSQVHLIRQAVSDNPHIRVQAMGYSDFNRRQTSLRETLNPEIESSHLQSLVDIYRPHRIVVTQNINLSATDEQALLNFRSRGITINTAEEFFALVHGKIPVESLKTSVWMYGAPFHSATLRQASSRLINLILAAVLLVVLTPVGLLIAFAILLESWGPIFYSQERVGFRGRCFCVVKFRSMRTDAESKTGPTWASKNDPRITRVGAVLRKLRLDELPQLWNVFLGEMNLVGPRPERPHFVEILRQHIPFYDLRHSVRPGITGWAQVMAAYGDSIESSQLKVEYDLFYLQRASMSFDLYILFRTIKIALSGRGAQ